MSNIVYNEQNIKPGNTTIKLLINNQPTMIMANIMFTTIVLKDNNNSPVLTFSITDFYKEFFSIELPELNTENVQYYNTTEEESFQLNTIMDYSTQQAMVHLHDYIRNGKVGTEYDVLLSIDKLIKDNIGQYSITL